MRTTITTDRPDEPGVTPEPVNCPDIKDVVECKMKNCEFSLANDSCVPPPPFGSECPREPLTKCQRGNGWYSVGGILCQSPPGLDRGNCSLKHVAIAVNLNGPSQNDSRRIHHIGEMSTLYTDMHHTRHGIDSKTWKRSNCRGGIKSVLKQDRGLYSTLVIGRKEQWGQGRCVAYPVNITRDGRYELSFRTVETFWSDKMGKGARPRQFNIRLNNMLIFPELNILNKVEPCHGMALYTDFDVTDGKLTPAGLWRSQIPANRSINVEFCYGGGEPESNYDPDYIVSSFYIVELEPSNKIPPTVPPTLPPTTVATTRRTTTTTTEPTSTLPPLPSTDTPPVDCSKVIWCPGREECQWQLPHGPCIEIDPPRACTNDTSITGCRRGYSYYVEGGIVCASHQGRDYVGCGGNNGTGIEVVLAVNLNGPSHTCSHGVPHKAEENQQYSDQHDTRQGIHVETWPNSQCKSGITEIPSQDKPLYSTLIFGKNDKRGKGRCIKYRATITEDGVYEFNVRTAETWYTDAIRKDRKPHFFNIQLDGTVIWHEFNILHWVKACQGIEMIAEFEVRDGYLKPAGLNGFKIRDNNTVLVEFCYGNGEPRHDFYDPNYMVASFYIARFPFANKVTTPMPPSTITTEMTTRKAGTGSPVTCADFENAVDCNKREGCGYDLCKKICVETQTHECPKDSYLTKCRRGNSWYALCGLLCKSHATGKDKGKCITKGVVIAVNLNGPGLPGGDSKTIPHEADAMHLYKDFHPNPTRGEIDNVTAWENSQCKGGITGINDKDRMLYNSLIYGKTSGRGKGRCISYRVNITKDGRFEFNLRLVETYWGDAISNGVKPRYFNVRLNGELVLAEFNILRYVNPCQGMDLFTEFDITNGYLTPAGLPSSKISESGLFLVEFCYGDGDPNPDNYDPNYLVPSFYIIELQSNDKIMPTMPTTASPKSTTESMGSTTDEKGITTKATPDPDLETTTEPCVTPTPACSDLVKVVECKKYVCEFRISTQTCLTPPTDFGLEFRLTKCRRGNVFYVVDGVLYRSHEGEDQGECDGIGVPQAINFYGPEWNDSRIITHKAEMPKDAIIKDHARQNVIVEEDPNSKCKTGATEVKVEDHELYSTLISGTKGEGGRGSCISYPTNLASNGCFELGIRTMEAFYSAESGSRPRQFNIRLNGMVVWPELNILHKVDTCQGLELVAEFQVQNGLLQPAGLHMSRIANDGIVFLEFCYGDGVTSNTYDPSYIAASFYITQLPCLVDPPPTTTLETTTEAMLTTITTPEVTTWPGPPGEGKECSKLRNAVGCKTVWDTECEFNLYNDTCVGPFPDKWCPDDLRLYSECYRGKVWYFVSGIPCKSHDRKDAGNCKIKSVTNAVNLNGPQHTDSRGIPHIAEMTSLYDDPHGTRRGIHIKTWERSQCPDGVQGIDLQNEKLFSSLILASNEGRKIAYRTNVTREGVYELNIRTVETFWSEAVGNGATPRYFNIWLNGKRIYAEYDMNRKVPACHGAEFITEFHVKDGFLTPAGLHPSRMPVIPEENPVMLEFCYGDGGNRSQYDPNYLVSSYYIVELHPGKHPMTAPPTLGPTTTELTTITPDPTIVIGECPSHTSLIPCKLAGCEFNRTSGMCLEIEKCPNDTSLTACRRGNVYYTVGGVACISASDKDVGDCDPEDVVIAVNLFGPEHSDSKQITHLADMNTFWRDEGNTRQDIHIETWSNSWCKEGVTGIPEQDRILYSSLIVGSNEARDPGQCLQYFTNIKTNGRYEFNVRTVETFWTDQIGNGAKPRQFNIRLNGMAIWSEFNLLHRASACQGIELLAEFDVTDRKLTAAGLPSTTIKANGGFEVEFCYGDGDASRHYDPNYIVSSFYIVKLKSSDMPLPPPPTFPPTPPTTKRTTTTTTRMTTTKWTTTTPKSILSTTLKPVPPGPTPTFPPGNIACKNARKKSICHCLDPHNNCDAIYQPGGSYGDYHCVQRQIFCRGLSKENLDRFFPIDSCVRARATYSYGGFICNNEYLDAGHTLPYTTMDDGNCYIEKTILAIRFNGNDSFKDSRQVVYVPMSQKPPNYPNNYEFNYNTLGLEGKGANTLCHELTAPKRLLSENDRPLWIHYVTGKNNVHGPFCFNYTIPIEEDGSYELNVKTIEYETAEKDERAFNIFLNGIPVFREIEPFKIWKAICVPIELISVFEVSDGVTNVSPRGFPTYPIQKSGMEVAFCNGECTTFAKREYSFSGVAFSVVKLEPQ